MSSESLAVEGLFGTYTFGRECVLRELQWSQPGRLVCEMDCPPFWLENAQTDRLIRLRLDFGDPIETSLNLGDDRTVSKPWAFEIEELSILRDHPVLWNHGPRAQIFCSEPMPDAAGFVFELAEIAGGWRDPFPYLTHDYLPAQWLQYVSTKGYRLLEAPTPIVKACLPLLERRKFKFQIIGDLEAKPNTNYLAVVFDGNWVVAEELTAIARSAAP